VLDAVGAQQRQQGSDVRLQLARLARAVAGSEIRHGVDQSQVVRAW
jgi:hypothetical protein